MAIGGEDLDSSIGDIITGGHVDLSVIGGVTDTADGGFCEGLGLVAKESLVCALFNKAQTVSAGSNTNAPRSGDPNMSRCRSLLFDMHF